MLVLWVLTNVIISYCISLFFCGFLSASLSTLDTIWFYYSKLPQQKIKICLYISLSLSLSLFLSLCCIYIYDSILFFKYTLPCHQKKNKSTLMLMESSTLTSPGESLPPWYYWWYKKVFFFVDVFDEVRDSANYVLWRDFFACSKPI